MADPYGVGKAKGLGNKIAKAMRLSGLKSTLNSKKGPGIPAQSPTVLPTPVPLKPRHRQFFGLGKNNPQI
jgi:hypothetical protein